MSVASASNNAATTGNLLGRAAQTAANPNVQPTNIWTQTIENTGSTPATGLQPVTLAGTALSKLAPSLGPGMAAGAAAVSLAATIRGIAEAGVHSGSASDVGTGTSQQASAIGDQVMQLLHLSDDPNKPAPDGVLGHIAAGFGLLTSLEQMLCMPLSFIPTPALPAVRIMDMDVGMPHAHMHPPNLTPPNPVPVPLPSTGPVIPIPYVSGASTVLINGMPAARCGDMGLGVFCGGFFPMFEIFLGSSSVWLEGSRAARVGTDITKHCIFSNPKSIVKCSDVPIGPMIGTTVSGSTNVLIGGFPLPSLSGMAIGAAFKGLFKGLSKLCKALKKGFAKKFLRLADKEVADDAVTGVFSRPATNRTPNLRAVFPRACKQVDDLMRNGKLMLGGDEAYQNAVEAHLRKIACTEVGQKMLDEIGRSSRRVYIEPWEVGATGNTARRATDGAFVPGRGSNTTIHFNPDPNCGRYTPGSPPDTSLAHELGHARNNALGNNARYNTVPGGFDKNRWSNMEEYNNINNLDNPYREEWGLPTRTGHNSKP